MAKTTNDDLIQIFKELLDAYDERMGSRINGVARVARESQTTLHEIAPVVRALSKKDEIREAVERDRAQRNKVEKNPANAIIKELVKALILALGIIGGMIGIGKL